MKTAEEYYEQLRKDADMFMKWNTKSKAYKAGFESLVAAVRADALAEKPKEPDAVPTKKPEWDRFHKLFMEMTPGGINYSSTLPKVVEAYAATFPPRPKRSPGQRLFESERDSNSHWGKRETFHGLSEMTQAQFETRAKELSIQPAE